MIDWLTFEVPYPHRPLDVSKLMKVSSEGDVEWISLASHEVEGSFDSSIYMRSVGCSGEGMAAAIRIDGNPSKFLQGHNIFGSMDVFNLARTVFVKCLSSAQIPYSFDMMQRLSNASVTRVDITKSFQLRNRADVLAWIRAAEFKSRSRSGRPQTKGGTLYFNKSSRRWALKFYSKGQEIQAGKGHSLPKSFTKLQVDYLTAYADPLLRCEIMFRSLELKTNGINALSDLTAEKCNELYQTYLGRIEMNAQAKLPDDKAHELPRSLISSYTLWKEGADLRQMLPKPTYYRHRSGLLEYGIDIALACDDSHKSSNVVPLIRVLTAEPVSVPSWAHKENLIFDSSTIKRAGSGLKY